MVGRQRILTSKISSQLFFKENIAVLGSCNPNIADSRSHTESISLDDLGDFVAKGARAAKPILITVAREQAHVYYKKLDKWLAKQLDPTNNAESGVAFDHDSTSKEDTSEEQAAVLLTTRAVMAECALQAVLKANKTELRESRILGDASMAEPESFFDGMLKTVQKIGPAVSKHGPKVIRYGLPILLKGLNACIDTDEAESSRSQGVAGAHHLAAGTNRPTDLQTRPRSHSNQKLRAPPHQVR